MTNVFSAQEKVDAVRREIHMRKVVYPNRIAAGKMSEQRAKMELAIMVEIATDYERLAERERLPLSGGTAK